MMGLEKKISKKLKKTTNIDLESIMKETTSVDIANRRTKIVCTLGPACNSVDILVKMIDAGMDVARFNFSHGDHTSHKIMLDTLRKAIQLRPAKSVALLLDTKGPEIRTGKLKDGKNIFLKNGQSMKITTNYDFVGDESCIACSYTRLPKSVKPGNTILIADGNLSCKVNEVGEDYVMVTVMNDAVIGERKNVNLPKVKVELPCIGPKEIDDITNFGIPNGYVFVAASFVQSASDVTGIKKLLAERNSNMKVICKIENVEGIANFDEILEECDGVMVARGDMGMEIPPEKVFLAQKHCIGKCNVAGKPVITATQMLESMVKNPRPTRAEVSDVANAVLDGTDAVMLSGESANGAFPVEAVAIMAKICVEAEACLDYKALYRALSSLPYRWVSVCDSLASQAVASAIQIHAKLIICCSNDPQMPAFLAKYRPKQKIIAVNGAQHLNLSRNVSIVPMEYKDTNSAVNSILNKIKKDEGIQEGDKVVVVTKQEGVHHTLYFTSVA